MITRIPQDTTKRVAAHLGCEVDTANVVRIESEARSQGHAAIVCTCGHGTEPNEPEDGGLYLTEDNSIGRVCGSCWLAL